MENQRKKVGVFDSGIGGLTVLGELVRRFQGVDFYYYGDNGNAPYGEKSEEEILSLTRVPARAFQKLGVDAVVIACNTATANAINALRKEFSFPFVGTEPAIKPACKECRHVLVLATPATVRSARFQTLLKEAQEGSAAEVTVYGAPNLAYAIECAVTRGETLTLNDHLPHGFYDGIVLGCTHYGFFGREIATYYSARVFDGAFGIAKRLFEVLKSDCLGTELHFCPVLNSNICSSNLGKNRVIFLGKWKKLNKKAFFTNICSKNS